MLLMAATVPGATLRSAKLGMLVPPVAAAREVAAACPPISPAQHQQMKAQRLRTQRRQGKQPTMAARHTSTRPAPQRRRGLAQASAGRAVGATPRHSGGAHDNARAVGVISQHWPGSPHTCSPACDWLPLSSSSSSAASGPKYRAASSCETAVGKVCSRRTSRGWTPLRTTCQHLAAQASPARDASIACMSATRRPRTHARALPLKEGAGLRRQARAGPGGPRPGTWAARTKTHARLASSGHALGTQGTRTRATGPQAPQERGDLTAVLPTGRNGQGPLRCRRVTEGGARRGLSVEGLAGALVHMASGACH